MSPHELLPPLSRVPTCDVAACPLLAGRVGPHGPPPAAALAGRRAAAEPGRLVPLLVPGGRALEGGGRAVADAQAPPRDRGRPWRISCTTGMGTPWGRE